MRESGNQSLRGIAAPVRPPVPAIAARPHLQGRITVFGGSSAANERAVYHNSDGRTEPQGMTQTLYDEIGQSYAWTRQPDPRIAAAILEALGDARSVVNVGAGAGSYEPAGKSVVAVEPSWHMIRQRPSGAPVVVQAMAEALPFRGRVFDAALAVLTLHHWTDWRRGLDEMRRVANRLVIFTIEPTDLGNFWLTEAYFPEIIELDRGRCPSTADIAHLIGSCRVYRIPIPHDCVDGFLAAFWRRPEAYLDPAIRAAISGFALLDQDVVARGVALLKSDLESGAWEERFGHLRSLEALDVCYRLLVAD
jgi:SAM-dependent methyltransferase